MSKTASTFSRRLYTDHLEEVGFLLAQREELLHDPEIKWPDIGEFEDRLIAHLEGLVLGGNDADDVSREFLTSDDCDNIRAASFALAHSKNADAIVSVVSAIDSADETLVQPFVSGMLHAPSSLDLSASLLPMLKHDSPAVRMNVISLLGYRRQGDPNAIAACLDDSESAVVKAAAIAVRRFGNNEAKSLLNAALVSANDEVGIEIALTLITLGDTAGFNWLQEFCADAHEDYFDAPVFSALTGSRPLSPQNNIATIKAIGIYGRVGDVDLLIDILEGDDDALKPVAAESLALMTSSGLTEEATETEEMFDIDGELVDSEDTTFLRVSTSATEWSKWWKENRAGFPENPDDRIRLGKRHGSSLIVSEIADPDCPYQRRELAYQELAILNPGIVAFEPDWFIERQMASLSQLRAVC